MSATMAAGRRHDLLSKVSRRITPWFRTKTVRARHPSPMISITFDDIPDSAFDTGASLLDRSGAAGTFYIAGGLCGTRYRDWTFATPDHVAALAARGHEIACHTFGHPDMQGLDAAAVTTELDANAAFLSRIGPGLVPTNFAYPYGSVAIPQKRAVQRRFRSARGTREGINRGVIDLGQLLAVRLYDHLRSPEALERLIDETVATNGWLIFYTHDVAEQPSDHGCTPGFLDRTLAIARRRACPVVTVDAAVDRLFA